MLRDYKILFMLKTHKHSIAFLVAPRAMGYALERKIRFVSEQRTTTPPTGSFLAVQAQFLFEKWTKTYRRYVEGSITEENCALAARGWQSSELCLEAVQPERRP